MRQRNRSLVSRSATTMEGDIRMGLRVESRLRAGHGMVHQTPPASSVGRERQGYRIPFSDVVHDLFPDPPSPQI
jgi:hypothetical protein